AFAGQHAVLFGTRIVTPAWAYVVLSLSGTLGYLVGSIAGWGIGVYGGRPLAERRSGLLHLGPERLERAERWFDRWEDWAVLLGRITPVVRSFVSIPAGIFRMPFGRYTLLTIPGSALWCFAWAAIVGAANGTDALVLALDALGIGPGDEVICPSFTFYATAEAIARRGATPVFADIDPATLNLDPEDVAARVTERTRALMPVHLFGRVMPLAGLAELGVPILEDAAQAFGAEGVARLGVLSTFSFFPTKNLFARGDGRLTVATDEVPAD